ncbi:MAG: hypothetical protein JSV89_03165 [Spirochaetaceae bacterium]|nr:MAG: hypothetical protein JSV89_03165 [Spirochaetaceae bacterium]
MIDESAHWQAVQPPGDLSGHPTVRGDFAAYIHSAAVADRCFGILMEALNDTAVWDNTLVIPISTVSRWNEDLMRMEGLSISPSGISTG